MFNTYLPTFYHFMFLLTLFLLWLVNLPVFILITFLVYVGTLLLYRRNSSSYQMDTAFKRGVIFSAVNGKVIQIRKNIKLSPEQESLTEIKIVINPWNETGIYLPISSEVQDFFLSGEKGYFRYGQKNDDKIYHNDLDKLSLTLRSIDSDLIRMDFIRCIMGSLPEIFVMPGDRGKQQANIGHFPLGGTLLLYLPDKYEILIHDRDKIIAGETLIAGVKAVN